MLMKSDVEKLTEATFIDMVEQVKWKLVRDRSQLEPLRGWMNSHGDLKLITLRAVGVAVFM